MSDHAFRSAAFVTAGIGAIFSSILPNFANVLPSWWGVYGWFFGVGVAAIACYLICTAAPKSVAREA